MEAALRAAGDQVEFLSTLDRQLEDGVACIEMLTAGYSTERSVTDQQKGGSAPGRPPYSAR